MRSVDAAPNSTTRAFGSKSFSHLTALDQIRTFNTFHHATASVWLQPLAAILPSVSSGQEQPLIVRPAYWAARCVLSGASRANCLEGQCTQPESLTMHVESASIEFSGRIGQSWQPKCNVGKDKEMADPTGDILTLEEVAAYLKAGKRTVYRLAQQGAIPAFKLGGTWRFRREELDRWIAASIEKNPKLGER